MLEGSDINLGGNACVRASVRACVRACVHISRIKYI